MPQPMLLLERPNATHVKIIATDLQPPILLPTSNTNLATHHRPYPPPSPTIDLITQIEKTIGGDLCAKVCDGNTQLSNHTTHLLQPLSILSFTANNLFTHVFQPPTILSIFPNHQPYYSGSSTTNHTIHLLQPPTFLLSSQVVCILSH
ncbi:hypothetical protein RRG08_036211 [Elysia crispata]|uniref:Uncharacterized protein n=1 Tax=Elysia crispata TaxID=231223 RepID=A0AAE0XEV4_9GAST|nr:hypothetical protein RRG08_036211 [Elysia crispata]